MVAFWLFVFFGVVILLSYAIPAYHRLVEKGHEIERREELQRKEEEARGIVRQTRFQKWCARFDTPWKRLAVLIGGAGGVVYFGMATLFLLIGMSPYRTFERALGESYFLIFTAIDKISRYRYRTYYDSEYYVYLIAIVSFSVMVIGLLVAFYQKDNWIGKTVSFVVNPVKSVFNWVKTGK